MSSSRGYDCDNNQCNRLRNRLECNGSVRRFNAMAQRQEAKISKWELGQLFSMKVKPLTLCQANELVAKWHRHHKPTRGHRFSIGAEVNGEIVGAAIVSRPVSRCVDPYSVAEVTRLVTNGYKNACSFLYGACARIAREMGFSKIQTYILDSESGKSLSASGWIFEQMTNGGDWNHSKQFAGKRRTDQPMSPKQRWSRKLNSSNRTTGMDISITMRGGGGGGGGSMNQ